MSSRSEYDSSLSTSEKPNRCRPYDEEKFCPPKESTQPAAVSEEGRPTTTVMIYLAGDNNLSEECIYALTEIKKAEPTRLVRVLAQYDPADEFLPTQRYEIRLKGDKASKYPIAIDLIDQYPFACESPNSLYIRPPYGERRERRGEGGTGDPKMLFNFVAFCVHKYEADNYVLIVCGHGAGIYRDFLMRDQRPDGYLTIHELRRSLTWMRDRLQKKDKSKFKLDIFGMDVCLMSMAEVTYELRDCVDIAIGCESYSPAAGWPYRQTIEAIKGEAGKLDLEKQKQFGESNWTEISKRIVQEYVKFYSDYWLAGLSVTMSALKVDRIHQLASRVNELASVMLLALQIEGGEKEKEPAGSHGSPSASEPKRRGPWKFSDALVLAHWRAQSFNGELYVDLADFCDCLAPYAPRYISNLCEELSSFIKDDLTLSSCFWGRHYQYSYGISIYFPWDSIVPYYGASIGFPTASNWAEFLKKYIQVTRREPRNAEKYPHLLEKIREDVRMGSDKMGSDKMGSDKGGNPIHSMRNPPIVFVPDKCIDDDCRVTINRMVQKRLMIYADEFPPYSGARETAQEDEDDEMQQAIDELYGNQDEKHPDSESDKHDAG